MEAGAHSANSALGPDTAERRAKITVRFAAKQPNSRRSACGHKPAIPPLVGAGAFAKRSITRPADVAQQLAGAQPYDRSLYGLYGVARLSVSIL